MKVALALQSRQLPRQPRRQQLLVEMQQQWRRQLQHQEVRTARLHLQRLPQPRLVCLTASDTKLH